jgi:hypothetical protein
MQSRTKEELRAYFEQIANSLFQVLAENELLKDVLTERVPDWENILAARRAQPHYQDKVKFRLEPLLEKAEHMMDDDDMPTRK